MTNDDDELRARVPDQPPAPLDRELDRTPVLVVLRGADLGRRHALRDQMVIGRDHHVEFPLGDDGVSRRHCVVRRGSDGELIIEDLDSLNGTFVNGRRVSRAQLCASDRISMGVGTVLGFAREERVGESGLQAQRLDLLGQLTAGVAHDFNNLLSTILANVAFLQDKPVAPQDSDAVLGDIESAARRASDLTGQLLAFARPQPPVRELVELRRLIAEAVGLLRRTLPHAIEITTAVPAEAVVVGDSTQLMQVVMNACVNAGQAMPDGGMLRIAARTDAAGAAPFVRLTIEDTGVGMAPETLASAFRPFFTTKQRGEGTGLGLATARRIVREHGGEIELSSQVGVGTQFCMILPAAALDQTVRVRVHRTARPRLAGSVLVVDDDALVRATTQRLLERFGLTVTVAADGMEAVSAYARASGSIDLAIVDLDLPKLGGEQAIAEMRHHHAGLRALVTSGLADAASGGRMFRRPDTRLLMKPYDAEALWRHVAEMLGQGETNLEAAGLDAHNGA